jgi:hypothetical protein
VRLCQKKCILLARNDYARHQVRACLFVFNGFLNPSLRELVTRSDLFFPQNLTLRRASKPYFNSTILERFRQLTEGPELVGHSEKLFEILQPSWLDQVSVGPKLIGLLDVLIVVRRR